CSSSITPPYITASVLPPRPPPTSTLFPYTTLFRSPRRRPGRGPCRIHGCGMGGTLGHGPGRIHGQIPDRNQVFHCCLTVGERSGDRKSTRLNSSHVKISYAVFCLKKKTDNIST